MKLFSIGWIAFFWDVSLAFVNTNTNTNTNTHIYTFSKNLPSSTSLHSSLGDLFSGITGSAPSKLDPPIELLSGTTIDPSKQGVDLACVYKGTKDGWSAVDFHECVDGRGSAIVVALTSSGKRFGGYNPLGWMSTDDYASSNAAFLWCQKNSKAIQIPILSGGNTAIYDYATGGPCFGAADLQIGPPKAAIMGGFAGPDMMDASLNAGTLTECTTSIGGAYDVPPKGSSWPFGTSKIVEMEVYCNANINPGSAMAGSKWWPF